MAVENKYVSANLEADKHETAAFTAGDKMFYAVARVTTAAADDDLSVYRLFRNVPADLIPAKIEIYCGAITGGVDFDLGFYKPTIGGVAGAVIDREKLASTLDLSSAITQANALDGLENLAANEAQERIYELAGDTLNDHELGYDIALTAVTVGSGVDTIIVKAWFVQG